MAPGWLAKNLVETQAWLRGLLGEGETAEKFTVVTGDFAPETTAYARSIGAQWIVVPAGEPSVGRIVTSLADAVGVPVLVARAATSFEAIVAATDLESGDFPILRQAAELGQKLRIPVIALHNVNPIAGRSGIDVIWGMATPMGVGALRTRQERLEAAALETQTGGQPMICSELDPVNAIIDKAGALDADLVVVGTRGNGWFKRLFGDNVASNVVDRAVRSVLVVPIATVG